MVKRERHDRPTDPPAGPLRVVWVAAGLVLAAIGVAGLILPLVPGVLFLILAAACFARGSPRLERRLLEHPTLGPSIVDWRRDGAIPRRGKIAAFCGMAFSLVLVALSDAPAIAVAASAALIGAGALYVGTRPTRPAPPERTSE